MLLKKELNLIYRVSLPLRISKLIGGNIIIVLIIYTAINSYNTLFPYFIFLAALVEILFLWEFVSPFQVISQGHNLIIKKNFSKKIIPLQNIVATEVRPLKDSEQLPYIAHEGIYPVRIEYGIFILFTVKDHIDRVQEIKINIFKGSKEVCDLIHNGIKELNNSKNVE